MANLRWGSSTHVGRVRPNNEDSLVTSKSLFAVADGMGGHAAGEVASRVALDTLLDTLTADGPPSIETLVDGVRSANHAVYQRALDDPGLRGMGTTLTAVALVNDGGQERLAVVNVGDSRTYVVQDGRLQRVTRDHSYVEDLVAAGEITAEEARYHPQRNIVTRALGIDPDVDVDAWEVAPVAGDRYLVCSDGLFDEVDDLQIAGVLTGTDDPQQAADTLVQMANDAGGRDNVSVIVLDVTGDAVTRDGPDATMAVPMPVAIASISPIDTTATEVGDRSTAAATAVTAGMVATDPSAETLPVPTATATMPMPVTALETRPTPPADTKRRRRVGPFAVLFILALLAIAAIALVGVIYYGRTGYYVTFRGNDVTLYRGHEGGVLWVQPTVSEVYPVSRDDLSPKWQERVAGTITFSSRSAADRWFATLQENPDALPSLATTTTAATTTTTTAATTTTPTTAPATTAAPPATSAP